MLTDFRSFDNVCKQVFVHLTMCVNIYTNRHLCKNIYIFYFFMILLLCNYKYFVSLLRGAMDWSVVYECAISYINLLFVYIVVFRFGFYHLCEYMFSVTS